MNKVEMVKTELNYIKNSRIRKSAEIFVNMLPDYFFTTAASSTGKYHPAFAAGEGGLLRHSKAAAYILNEIISTKTFGSDFTPDEKDLLRFAILVHDGFKHGITEEQYTKHEHPLICATCIRAAKDKMELTDEQRREIKEAFSTFDKTGLEPEELRSAMQALGFDAKNPDVQKMLDKLDKYNKPLNFEQYMDIMMDKNEEKDPEIEMRKAFRVLCEDGTDKITLKSLSKICADLGEKISDEELQEMINEANKEEEEVGEEDFIKIMQKTGMF